MTNDDNPDKHRRRTVRLRGYDYTSTGAYFVTICASQRECIFGEIVDGETRLNDAGRIVEEEWLRTEHVRPNVSLDAFIVMPNHFHGIVVINDNVGATRRVAPTIRPIGPAPQSLGAIMGQFKSITTKRINVLRGTSGAPVWQRNYYEHIVRDEADLDRLREYIVNNPLRWELDQLHPDNPSKW